MAAKFFLIETVPKRRGVGVRVVLSSLPGAARLDVREYEEQRLRDPDSAIPTERGINVPVALVPQLAHALRRAEAEAIAAGHLTAYDYRRVQLEVHPDLLPAA